MADYFTKPFELVHNPQYQFHKLYIDNECQFDTFMKDIEMNGNKKELASFASIIAYMDAISDLIMLPKTKFRHIENAGRKDVFEFKKDNLRVYVIMQRPDVYIILGGYKNNQKKDINTIARKATGFSI